MKHKLNIALASAVIALPVLAVSLPLTENFNDGLGEFTVEDANNDGITVKKLSYYGYNYSDGLQYAGSADKAADDWLFTPALTLNAGYVYELTFQYKVVSSGSTQRIEWKAGSSASSEAMAIAVSDVKEYVYNYGSWAKETVTVKVPTDGEYYLGMHIVSAAGQGSVYIDQIEMPEGVNGASPKAPAVKNPVFTVNGDALNASFEITLPSATALGDDLTGEEITTTITRSDSEEAATVKGMAGSTVTYTDEEASLSPVTYSFTCTVNDAVSPAVQIMSSPALGVPKPVENFTVSQEGNTFSLSWDAVTEPETEGYLFIPSQVSYVVKCGAVVVADHITDLETEYTHPMPEDGQEAVSFSIMAVAGGKQSSTSTSRVCMVGNPYAGEFHESFANRDYTYKTWTVENNKNNVWSTSIGSSYSPVVDPQDNDGGCLQFYDSTSENIHIWSPVLDLSGLTNPKLKFWVYLYPSSYYDVDLQCGFLTDGEETLLGDPISLKSGEEGWKEFIFDLPENAVENLTQLFFVGTGGSYGKMFVDNISIKNYLEHNLAIEATSPVRYLEIGDEVNFIANVSNQGINDESVYNVNLFADGEKVATQEGVTVGAMSNAIVEVPFKVLPKYAGTDVCFTLSIELESEMDDSDNSCELVIPVRDNDLPKVQNLTAESDNDNVCVSLAWELPEISSEPLFTPTTESFEDWTPGTTEPISGWVFIDADGVQQAAFNNVNYGKLYAAMVAENFTADYSWNPSLTCKDGTKCLVITPAATSYNTDTDNWVISPVVKGGSNVTFYALTFASYGSPEQFDIMWSEGGVTTEDFTLLGTYSAPNNSWTETSFELPAGASRFAIRMHGRHQNPLCFDSFSFTAESEPAVLTGLNVYRDHALLCSLPAECETHVDDNPVRGKSHTYHVTAQYDKGESAYCDEATALIDINAIVGTIDVETTETEYYSLDGLRIEHPAKGQPVIVRKGCKFEKTIRF